jgi:hypothetical protein
LQILRKVRGLRSVARDVLVYVERRATKGNAEIA